MDGATITTDYFRVPASVLIRRMMSRWIRLWGVVVALPLPVLLAVALATHDLRFALIALMYCFCIVPAVITIVYFSYALRPEVATAVLPHRLVIRPDVDVTIVYRPDEGVRVPSDKVVPWRCVSYLRDCGSYWLFDYAEQAPHKT